MAKKRKLRSSAAEQEAPAAAAPPADQCEPSPPPVDEPQTMAVDESNAEAPQVQEEQEEQPQGQEEGDNGEQQQSEAAVNGSTTSVENGAEGENNGGEEDEEEEEDDEADEEPLEKLLEPFTKDQLLAILRKAVDKHADLIEEVREIADEDPAHRKIFVHGLGWDTTAETLTSAFAKYGEIEDCKHVTDRVTGKSKGYAFILFKRRKGARRALKQPQKKIGNRTTSCQLASTGPVPAPPPSAPPVSEYTQRKIFVSNVSADVDPGRLLEYFKQYGEVEEGPLGIDKQTGRPKGFALFVYKSVDGARRALEEPHKNFEGHTLHCQKAIDGPKQGKPGYGGGHHQSHQQYNHPYNNPRKERNKYGGSSGASGHMMNPAGPAVGYNPGPVAAPGLNPMLGQALTALLTTQGGGLGFGNYLGGAPMNQGGMPAYGSQPVPGYGMQPGMQGGYPNPPMGGQGAVRPPPGGPPYMGH